MKARKLIPYALLGASFGSVGCILDLGEADPEDGVPPRVQEAFDRNCAVSGCHDSTASGGLNLLREESASIIDGETPNSEIPLVALGDVQGSYLALKLLASAPDSDGIVGDPMPRGGGGDPADIAIILGWIAGANLPSGVAGELTFDDAIWPIMEASCTCHNSEGGQAGLSLMEDNAFDNTVGVLHESAMTADQDGDGEQEPEPMSYFEPQAVTHSYIWYKLTGTQKSIVGGGGGQMPPGTSSALKGGDLATIRSWIIEGACESDPDCACEGEATDPPHCP
jgi:hypothetical protein